MKTKREIVIPAWRDMHALRIPQGTPVQTVKNPGGGFVVRPASVVLESKTAALFKHDSTYFYIWIDGEDVTAC